ncbi:hypothetical protein V1507DRAFT_453997, partial [Lipomyces tetrasporus]
MCLSIEVCAIYHSPLRCFLFKAVLLFLTFEADARQIRSKFQLRYIILHMFGSSSFMNIISASGLA